MCGSEPDLRYLYVINLSKYYLLLFGYNFDIRAVHTTAQIFLQECIDAIKCPLSITSGYDQPKIIRLDDKTIFFQFAIFHLYTNFLQALILSENNFISVDRFIGRNDWQGSSRYLNQIILEYLRCL